MSETTSAEQEELREELRAQLEAMDLQLIGEAGTYFILRADGLQLAECSGLEDGDTSVRRYLDLDRAKQLRERNWLGSDDSRRDDGT